MYPCCMGVTSVFAITERRDMGLYEVPLSMSLLGFGMGTMLANFHMCGIMLVLRVVFNMLVRNAGPRGLMCFRCLMFNLSGPCELLYFTLFDCLLDLSCSECMLYVLCCSVNGSVCLLCCVFNSVCELFGETIRNVFGCGCCFIAECYGCVVEVLCWIDRIWSSTECIPSICFVCVFVCRKLSHHLRV